MTLAINANVSVELTVELLMETRLALLDREVALRKEAATHEMPVVREIARRQLARVVGSLAGIDDALEGATLKAEQAAAAFRTACGR